MPTASNQGISEASPAFHYKAFLLFCLSWHLWEMQVMLADFLALNKEPVFVLVWAVFISFHNSENGAVA